jgi:hypothetical protein
VEDVIGLIEMEDADRAKLLGMPEAKLEAVAKWCNRYPDIDLKFDIEDKDDIATGDAVTVLVQLERDFDGELPPVRSVASLPYPPLPASERYYGTSRNVELLGYCLRARQRRDTRAACHCSLSVFPCPMSRHCGGSARPHRFLTHNDGTHWSKSRYQTESFRRRKK